MPVKKTVKLRSTKAVKVSARSALVAGREGKNGNFRTRAGLRMRLEAVMREHYTGLMVSPAWDGLSAPMQVALTMYAEKISRILNGDANEVDHWRDIGGYSELVVETLPVINED